MGPNQKKLLDLEIIQGEEYLNPGKNLTFPLVLGRERRSTTLINYNTLRMRRSRIKTLKTIEQS
jgi:hypothetical protein